MSQLLELLKYEGQQLTQDFERATVSGSGTPQEIADFREGFFKTFIERYFPLPHRVTKGQIIDSYNLKSNSIDCIVLNPCHPKTEDVSGKFSVIFADGVDAAIELKSDLSRADELTRGLKQICSVKKLRRAKSPLIGRRGGEISDLSRQVPSFIFALRAKSDLADTGRDMENYYIQENTQLAEQVDYIVVPGQGIIYNCKHPDLCYGTPKKTGIYIEGWEDLTLAAFVLRLNTVVPAQAHIQAPLLEHYLKTLQPRTHRILNEKRT